MTIDLKWGLPFVLPFVLIALAKAVFWAAGAEIGDTGILASMSLVLGPIIGIGIVLLMCEYGIKWNIRIGGAK